MAIGFYVGSIRNTTHLHDKEVGYFCVRLVEEGARARFLWHHMYICIQV